MTTDDELMEFINVGRDAITDVAFGNDPAAVQEWFEKRMKEIQEAHQ